MERRLSDGGGNTFPKEVELRLGHLAVILAGFTLMVMAIIFKAVLENWLSKSTVSPLSITIFLMGVAVVAIGVAHMMDSEVNPRERTQEEIDYADASNVD